MDWLYRFLCFRTRVRACFLALVLLTALSGCGGGNTSNTPTPVPPVSVSTGSTTTTATTTVATTNDDSGFGRGATFDDPVTKANQPNALSPAALTPPASAPSPSPGTSPAPAPGASPTATPTPTQTPTPTPTPGNGSVLVPIDAMPPVGNQGPNGSCVAWSWGYTFGSCIANIAKKSNNASTKFQVNPLLFYAAALTRSGNSCGDGTTPSFYTTYLEEFGAWSNDQRPTYPGGTEPTRTVTAAQICDAVATAQASPPTPDAYFQPQGSIAFLQIDPTAQPGSSDDIVEQVKTNIKASGLPVPIAIHVPIGLQGYTTASKDDPNRVLYAEYKERKAKKTGGGCELSGHGMVVVGYNDTLGPNDVVTSPVPTCDGNPIPPDWTPSKVPGAFLVRNSWGSNFGVAYPGSTKGYIWISYDTFRHIVDSAAVFLPQKNVDTDKLSFSATAMTGTVAAWQFAVPGSNKVQLIFHYTLSQAVKMEKFTITTPENTTYSEDLGYSAHTGYLFVTRSDGNQWTAGNYKLQMQMSNSSTKSFTATATTKVAAAAGSSFAAAAPPPASQVKGCNANNVR